MEATSCVDEMGLLLECRNLDEGTRELENIARDAVAWGVSNEVEFEISKTGVTSSADRAKCCKRPKKCASA